MLYCRRQLLISHALPKYNYQFLPYIPLQLKIRFKSVALKTLSLQRKSRQTILIKLRLPIVINWIELISNQTKIAIIIAWRIVCPRHKKKHAK